MTLFKKAFKWLEKIFHNLFTAIDETVFPLIVDFVDALKKVVDSPVGEVLVTFFPKVIDREKFIKVKGILEAVSFGLNVPLHLDGVDTIEELEAELNRVYGSLNWDSPAQRDEFLTRFGANFLRELHDGKLSFANAVMQVEYWYQNVYKKEAK